MLVEDLYASLKKATGSCDETENFRLLNLALDMLSNKKLVDPLLGTLDFFADGGYYFALPRDVKTPIKVNLNNNPSFARSRIFEFAQNTDGSVDGPEVGWSWSDRGYLPIQDETKLPAILEYLVGDEADNGLTCKVYGRDANNREISEVLIGAASSPDPGALMFYKIDRVVREVTTTEALLRSTTDETLARYYPDERVPEYRVIKLSQKAVSCRLLYRKHVFKITSQTDYIPVNSQLALIHAVKGVILLEQEDEAAEHHFAKAQEFLADEQASREENTTATEGMEIQSVTNTNISTRDCVIVADIYDQASEIFGPIGRQKLFDRITDAVEALANRADWDALRGAVDLWASDRSDVINPRGQRGDGYFVLPRIVESILAINYDGEPMMPRNRWAEFHVNGSGERYKSAINHWDEAGEVVLLNQLPISATTLKPIPVKVVAVPEDSVDNDTEIVIEGLEELANGEQRIVWRNGSRGWTCPCVFGEEDPGTNAPNFVRIDRIRKARSTSFIKLYTLTEGTTTTEVDETTVADYTGSVNGQEPTRVATGVEISNVTWNGSTSRTVRVSFAGTSGAGLASAYDSAGEITGSIAFTGENEQTFTFLALDGITEELTFTLTGLSVEWTDPPGTFTNIEIVRTVETITDDATYEVDTLLGYYEPDETEPRYRMIKVPSSRANRIRVLYRKRAVTIRAMHEPLHLKSRNAIINAMRAVKAEETDPGAGANFLAVAERYLGDQEWALNPTHAISLQFNEGLMPGGFGNIS